VVGEEFKKNYLHKLISPLMVKYLVIIFLILVVIYLYYQKKKKMVDKGVQISLNSPERENKELKERVESLVQEVSRLLIVCGNKDREVGKLESQVMGLSYSLNLAEAKIKELENEEFFDAEEGKEKNNQNK
jgi:cbb3-type cytochrome oxidase subunit 3